MERKAALALSRSRCNDPPQMIFAIAASNIYGRTVQQTATWFELPPFDVAALVGAAEQLQASSAYSFRCRTSAETRNAASLPSSAPWTNAIKRSSMPCVRRSPSS